jgi:hypothetical protein
MSTVVMSTASCGQLVLQKDFHVDSLSCRQFVISTVPVTVPVVCRLIVAMSTVCHVDSLSYLQQVVNSCHVYSKSCQKFVISKDFHVDSLSFQQCRGSLSIVAMSTVCHVSSLSNQTVPVTVVCR